MANILGPFSMVYIYSNSRMAYYVTYIHNEYLKAKRNFIYSTFEGKRYFQSLLENYRIDFEHSQNQSKSWDIYVTIDNLESTLNENIDNGMIPGKALFYFIIENGHGLGTRYSLQQLVEISVNPEIKKHYKKRKQQFILNDNWWEYVFLILFSSLVLVSLIISWIRII